METVGIDRAHYGLNAGDGQGPRVESDLGFTVWRRHINLGLIPHTQSSRIWRQASQVGQVPLMRHITERLGMGNVSVSRTWDSLPFVMVRRMPIVQARTIPAIDSMAAHKGQPEVDGSHAIALDSKGLEGYATASPMSIQREAQPVPSDQLPLVLPSAAEIQDSHQGGEPEVISNSGPSQSSEPSTASSMSRQRETPPVTSDYLPLVQRSLANMHDRHQGGMPEATGFHGPSQVPELSTVSPRSIQREAQPVTSELLPLVQRSAAGTHESHRDGVSDAAGSLPESPISKTPSSVFVPTSGMSMDAAPSSPVLRRVNRSSAASVSTGDATMGEAIRRTGSGKIPEVFVTEGPTQGLSSINGPDLTLLRHSLAREAGATSSLVLEAPIVRRTLRRDVPTVSDQSGTDVRADNRTAEVTAGYGNSNPDLTFVQSLSLVQNHRDGVVANGDSGSPHGSPQTSILRMRQAGPLDTQPMSTSSVRHESSATVPIILRSVRPTIRRASGVESAHEPVWNGIQRQKGLHVPSPLLPLIQRAERPLASSDSPTLIWRSPISGVPTGVPSFDGFTDYRSDSGSVSRNLMPLIARQVSHPTDSYIPRPGIPSLHEQAALAGSHEASISLNPAEVAEQVSRLLTRQLAVERERRGVYS